MGTRYNAQNIPRSMRDCWGPVVDDGSTVLLQADMSQVEGVLTFCYADDLEGLEMCADGVDLHSLLASKIYGCGDSKSASEAMMVDHNGEQESARQAAKPARHGWNYGMGSEKYSRMHGVSSTEAGRIFTILTTLHPKTSEWQKETVYEGIIHRQLDQGFGRMRRFMAPATFLRAAKRNRPLPSMGREAYERWLRWAIWNDQCRWSDREKAIAFRPASFLGDMWKIVCSRLPVQGLPVLRSPVDSELWTGTHDSFALEVRRERLASTGRMLVDEMQRPWPQLKVPNYFPKGFWAKVELKYGPTWQGEHKLEEVLDV